MVAIAAINTKDAGGGAIDKATMSTHAVSVMAGWQAVKPDVGNVCAAAQRGRRRAAAP
jgi:hypothetical protein